MVPHLRELPGVCRLQPGSRKSPSGCREDCSPSNPGEEGLWSFSNTPHYAVLHAPNAQVTYAQFKDRITRHFRRTPSKFKARYDFVSRHYEPGESIKEFVQALRATAVDCGFEDISQADLLDEMNKTQLVCHNSDTRVRMELFSKREAMTLDDVINFLTASEAASLDTMGLAGSQPHINVIKAKSGSQGRLSKEVTCFSCERDGHTSRDAVCPA